MVIAGAARSVTVDTLICGHWYDAVVALVDEALQADGQQPASHDLVRGGQTMLVPRLAARTPVGEALPGLAALVSAVAARPLGSGRSLRDIGDNVARALEVR
jgi:hypothetical protein